jgi:hypothetical protein
MARAAKSPGHRIGVPEHQDRHDLEAERDERHDPAPAMVGDPAKNKQGA